MMRRLQKGAGRPAERSNIPKPRLPSSYFGSGARAVIRLTGLPAPSRCPEATVGRGEDRIEILFGGGPGEPVRMDVEHRLLGDADPEAEQLRLLARLAELGYRVTRAPGPVA
jgi:hypothetical protein